MSAAIGTNISSMKYRMDESGPERAERLKPELDRQYFVPVLLKSVKILELLRSAPEGLRIEQIHLKTGIAKTTVFRIARTLVFSGFIRHNGNRTYSIAPEMWLGPRAQATSGTMAARPQNPRGLQRI